MVEPPENAPPSAAPDPAEVYALVEDLIEEGRTRPPSRNRHFEAWADPLLRAAYRLFGRLVDLRDDLRTATARQEFVHIATAPGENGGSAATLTYELALPQGRLKRVARLSPEEWSLFRRLCGELVDKSQAA